MLQPTQSGSTVQLVGQTAWQAPSGVQRSLCPHEPGSVAVQATHLLVAVSQSWCEGSHAAQSVLVEHVIVGTPWLSDGQSAPIATQAPNFEHVSPFAQPSPVSASQATHRCERVLQSCRPSEQAAQSLLLWQL